MSLKSWQQWGKRPEVELTLADRANESLPEMESTKQLVNLVSEVYKPGMRILDVGCNAGHYLRGLRRLDLSLDYTGVDAYEHYIKQARDIFSDDPHAEFQIRDILEPLSPDDPFDIVFCCNVIQHLPDFRVAVRNLLETTKRVCFVRTLLAENTTVVKVAITQEFTSDGEPLDFAYQNTWQSSYFVEFVRGLGWDVELIVDEFDATALETEYDTVKKELGTRVIDGKQVDGSILFNWVWAKMTPC